MAAAERSPAQAVTATSRISSVDGISPDGRPSPPPPSFFSATGQGSPSARPPKKSPSRASLSAEPPPPPPPPPPPLGPRRGSSGLISSGAGPRPKGDFEALIASGETRRFTLTPDRLQTMEARATAKGTAGNPRLVPKSAVAEYEAWSRIRGNADEDEDGSTGKGKGGKDGTGGSRQSLYEFLRTTGPEDGLPPPTGKTQDSSHQSPRSTGKGDGGKDSMGDSRQSLHQFLKSTGPEGGLPSPTGKTPDFSYPSERSTGKGKGGRDNTGDSRQSLFEFLKLTGPEDSLPLPTGKTQDSSHQSERSTRKGKGGKDSARHSQQSLFEFLKPTGPEDGLPLPTGKTQDSSYQSERSTRKGKGGKDGTGHSQQSLYEFLKSSGPEDGFPTPTGKTQNFSHQSERKSIPGDSLQGAEQASPRTPSKYASRKDLCRESVVASQESVPDALAARTLPGTKNESGSRELLYESFVNISSQLPHGLIPALSRAESRPKTTVAERARSCAAEAGASPRSETSSRRISLTVDGEADLLSLSQALPVVDSADGHHQSPRLAFGSTASVASSVSVLASTVKQKKNKIRSMLKLSSRGGSASRLSLSSSKLSLDLTTGEQRDGRAPHSGESSRSSTPDAFAHGSRKSSVKEPDGRLTESEKSRSTPETYKSPDKAHTYAGQESPPDGGSSASAQRGEASDPSKFLPSFSAEAGSPDDPIGSSCKTSVPSLAVDFRNIGFADMPSGSPKSHLATEAAGGSTAEANSKSHSEANERPTSIIGPAAAAAGSHLGLPSAANISEDEMHTAPTSPFTPTKQLRNIPHASEVKTKPRFTTAVNDVPTDAVGEDLFGQNQRKSKPLSYGEAEDSGNLRRKFLECELSPTGEKQGPWLGEAYNIDAVALSRDWKGGVQDESPLIDNQEKHENRDICKTSPGVTPIGLDPLRREVPCLLAAGDETTQHKVLEWHSFIRRLESSVSSPVAVKPGPTREIPAPTTGASSPCSRDAPDREEFAKMVEEAVEPIRSENEALRQRLERQLRVLEKIEKNHELSRQRFNRLSLACYRKLKEMVTEKQLLEEEVQQLRARLHALGSAATVPQAPSTVI